MTQPCIIYAIATILLSLTDAIRFKIKWGKVENIDHGVSRWLAIISGFGVYLWWVNDIPLTWWLAIAVPLLAAAFVFIRLALYDLSLNIFRIIFKINPTGRVDYVSTETSNYEDQHSEKVGFWWKRVFGFLGWLLMFLLYKVIFKA